MIVMCMRNEYLADPHFMKVIHKASEVFQKERVPLWVITRLNHDSARARSHHETVSAAKCELIWVFPRDVIDEVS